MSSREHFMAAGLTPGVSMLAQLPSTWWVVPVEHGEDTEQGGHWLLGGPLAGDPEVMVHVHWAVPAGGGRDLTEQFTRWLAEILASELCGTVMRTELTDKDIIQLNSQLQRLQVMLRGAD